MPEERKPLLTIEGLEKSFGDEKVINNFTLSILPEEVVCLLGASGSGKTTLINLLTGLIQSDSPNSNISLNIDDKLISLFHNREQFRE